MKKPPPKPEDSKTPTPEAEFNDQVRVFAEAMIKAVNEHYRRRRERRGKTISTEDLKKLKQLIEEARTVAGEIGHCCAYLDKPTAHMRLVALCDRQWDLVKKLERFAREVMKDE